MTKETLTLNFFCARKDKPFLVNFSRESVNERFEIETIERSKRSYSKDLSLEISTPTKIKSEEISFEDFKCPFCKSDDFVRCGTCRQCVCKGRTPKKFFKCRKSCSGHGVIHSTLSSFTGKYNSRKAGTDLVLLDE